MCISNEFSIEMKHEKKKYGKRKYVGPRLPSDGTPERKTSKSITAKRIEDSVGA